VQGASAPLLIRRRMGSGLRIIANQSSLGIFLRVREICKRREQLLVHAEFAFSQLIHRRLSVLVQPYILLVNVCVCIHLFDANAQERLSAIKNFLSCIKELSIDFIDLVARVSCVYHRPCKFVLLDFGKELKVENLKALK
jgi:hypothetical protein